MKKIPKTIPFTKEKYQEMKDKVIVFEQQQEEVMGRLIVARGMGDLSENGAYKYAKFELGNIKRQLRKLRGLLEKGFVVVSNTLSKEVVEFGSKVVIENHDGKQRTFLMVSKHESDPSSGKLAYSSPMGSVLMRKKVDDLVTVTTPTKTTTWKIISIR